MAFCHVKFIRFRARQQPKLREKVYVVYVIGGLRLRLKIKIKGRGKGERLRGEIKIKGRMKGLGLGGKRVREGGAGGYCC